MILIRHIENTISNEKVHEPIEAYPGKTIAAYAPPGAVACIYSGAAKPLPRRVFVDPDYIAQDTASQFFGDPSGCDWIDNPDWQIMPEDGSTLVFIETEADPISITAAIIGSAATFSAVTATATGIAVLAGVALAEFAVSAALSYGLNSLLAPSAAGIGTTKQADKASPTFGFDAISNTAVNGLSVPVLYGKHPVGGQIIQAYRVANDKDSQILKLLIALSEGPIHSIGQYTTAQNNLTGTALPKGLRINGVEASKYKDVSVSLRLGLDDQTACPGFEDVTSEYGAEMELTEPSVIYERTTADNVNAIGVNFVFTRGLFSTSKTTGEVKSTSVKHRIEIYELDGTTLVTSKTPNFKSKKQTPVSKTVWIDNLEPRRYIVRVKRFEKRNNKTTKQNNATVSGTLERRYATLPYPNIALLALTIRATEQLSGGQPTVIAMCKGRPVDNSDSLPWSNNPAWILKDVFTNQVYGGGNLVEAVDPDEDSFQEFADFCDEWVPKFTGATSAWHTISGTTAANASHAITGISSQFISNLKEGDAIRLSSDPDAWATIVDIFSQTSIWVDRPLGDGTSQTLQMNQGIERRCMMDRPFDAPKSLWETALEICATARAIPMRLGDTIKIKIEEQKAALQLFTAGNQTRGKWSITPIDPLERNNAIHVEFRNRDRNYDQDTIPASISNADLDQSDEVLRQERLNTIQLYGIVRATQAKRIAEYLLRVEQRVKESLHLEASIDSIALEPGDVFRFAHPIVLENYSGRIQGLETGSDFVTLDQVAEFDSLALYTYTERNSGTDALLSRDFKYEGGSTRELPFAPLHGTDGAIGRLYSIGRKFTQDDKFLAVRVGFNGKTFERTVDAISYVEDIYTDAAEPLDSSIFEPDAGDDAEAATSLAVVETSTENDVSTLALSWLAAAGAAYYNVYLRADSDGSPDFIGQTTGVTLSFDVPLPFGTAVTLIVQTVTATGQRTSIDTSPSILYVITREDGGTALITFPGNVTGAGFSNISGNLYSLSWTPVPGADGYEARYGNWQGGQVVYQGAAASFNLYVNRMPGSFAIRAKIGDYYSPDATRITAPTGGPAGYTTASFAATYFNFLIDGLAGNLTVVDWPTFTRALKQIDNQAPGTFRATQPGTLGTVPFDLGTVAATHVSVDVRPLVFIDSSPDALDLYWAMSHLGMAGEWNKTYIDWTLTLEYSSDGVTWNSIAVNSFLTSDIIVTGQFFRLNFSGTALPFDGETNWRVLLEALGIALYRV